MLAATPPTISRIEALRRIGTLPRAFAPDSPLPTALRSPYFQQAALEVDVLPVEPE
jgi:hypothetical protein